MTSEISGGRKNGGFTLRLKAGTHTLNGKQALALARTRHNLCNHNENDLTRARRQQKILLAIKSRVGGHVLQAAVGMCGTLPKALRTDMGPLQLMSLFAGPRRSAARHR